MTIEKRAKEMDRLAEKYLRKIKWEFGICWDRDPNEKKVKTLLLALMVEAKQVEGD